MSGLLPVMGLALLLVMGAGPGPAHAQDEAQTARQQMRLRLAGLIDQRDHLERSIAETKGEIETIGLRLAESRQRLATLKAGQKLAGEELARVRLRADEQAGVHERLLAGYKKRLRALYLYGPDASKALMASAQDFRDALARSQALTHLASMERRRLDDLSRARRQLNALRAELAQRKDEFKALSMQKAEENKRLEDLREKRLMLLTEFKQNHNRLAERIAALKEAETRLARTFALAGDKPSGGVLAARGSLSPPVEGRVVGRSGPGGRGVVIKARPGSQVRCPWWGRVAFAGPLAGYGKVAVVDHGQRVHTVLAHLGSLSVEAGQQIKAGAVLGLVDGAGTLYLEVRKGAKAQNPLLWLRLSP